MVTCLQVKVKTFFEELQEMTENTPNPPTISDLNGHEQTRRSPLVAVLAVLVSVEALAVAAGAIYFLSRIFLDTPENLSGAVVIFVISVVIAVGLVVTAIGIFKSKSWTRGAIVTWQVLQFAVATSFIQGFTQAQPIGWGLVAFSLLVLILVFTAKFPN